MFHDSLSKATRYILIYTEDNREPVMQWKIEATDGQFSRLRKAVTDDVEKIRGELIQEDN